MKVRVNRTEVDIFDGARVRHAVLQYFVRRRISTSRLALISVTDAHGHRIDLDAPLNDGDHIKLA